MTKQICGPSGRGPRILHPTRLYKRKERRNREGTNKIGRSKGGIEFKMDEGYSKLIIMCLYHHYILYCVYSSSVKTTIQVPRLKCRSSYQAGPGSAYPILPYRLSSSCDNCSIGDLRRSLIYPKVNSLNITTIDI